MSEQASWIVLKFGGSSVSSRENWIRIAEVIRKRHKEGYSVCMVQSALSGVSDQLKMLAGADQKTEAEDIIQKIKTKHYTLAQQMHLDAEPLIGAYFKELENLSRGMLLVGEVSPGVEARLLALGELMATKLGWAYLRKQNIEVSWHDARQLLKSEPQPNESTASSTLSATCRAEPEPELQAELNRSGNIVLTQGFIASDQEGKTVLLGRGGSDVSAAYFAAKLEAERLEIWTDVPGLFSADPSHIPSARLLKKITYAEAQEIATNGAHVLHPRSIYPARKHQIPIHVRCTSQPALEGTVISRSGADEGGMLKAVALRHDIKVISMESLNMWQQVGFLANAFTVFKEFGLSIDLISTSESNVTVSIDPSMNLHFEEVREAFVAALSRYCRVSIIDSATAVSLLGRKIRTVLHRLGHAFEIFREHRIHLISHAANDLNFTFVVNSEQADRLVQQLHQEVIAKAQNHPSFGDTWAALMKPERQKADTQPPWWRKKQKELCELTAQKGAVYVYDTEAITANIEQLRGLGQVDRFFYAMKANANRGVLKHIHAAGLGFECVSIGEVDRVLDLFPDIERDRILFTPNFAPREEYEAAFAHGIHLTLDNSYPLEKWPGVFENQTFFLRIDPGSGRGHHRHVKTGGRHSKFGIPRSEISEVKKRLEDLNATIKGLHAHVGSGIKDHHVWKNTALILREVAGELGGVEILDLGGGLGVPEQDHEDRLDVAAMNASLKDFKEAYPDYELWVEPGRFLVASAGVLLARITQLKGKGEVRYVGLETGMNSFIRPALYGASHTIVNLSKPDQPARQTVNIVGPICESGDKLGIDRRFPETKEGDVICIANTGAYGHVMSSNYNLRAPAAEIMLNDEW